MSATLHGPYRAVLIDIGETLVALSPSFAEVAVGHAAELGTPVNLNALRSVARDEFLRVAAAPSDLPFATSTPRSQAFWMAYYRRLAEHFGISDPMDFGQRLYRHCTRFESYAPLPGAVATLRRLNRRGARVVAASNWEGWLDALLAHLRLDRYFHATVVSGRIGVEKPDRRFFEQALQAAGVAAAEAVHVGDSFEADVEGARGAGIDAVWVSPAAATQADVATVPGIGDLPQLLLDRIVRPAWPVQEP